MTVKQQVLESISRLPDSASLEDIMYRVYVIGKVREGQDAVKYGRTITIEDLRKEVLTWKNK